MKRLQWTAAATVAMVLLAGSVTPAMAQGGVIPPLKQAGPPPLTPQQIEERNKEAAVDLTLKGVEAMPAVILQGGRILTQKFDPSMIGAAAKGAEQGSAIISYSLTGAKIIGGTAKDGWEGFKREGTQAVIEKGAEVAGQAAAGYATGLAVNSGVALGTAGGAAGIAYTTGSLFGNYLRNSVDVGQSLGLRGTIGDEVDNAWFRIAPDSLKELASGTPQVDLNDPAVWQQMRDTADRKRRQAMFDSVQRDNLEQQQQQAAAASLVGELSAPPSSPLASTYDPTAASLQAILDAARQAQPAPAAPFTPREPQASSGKVCRLDPKTGCHPGHDEKSHPGGCKLC